MLRRALPTPVLPLYDVAATRRLEAAAAAALPAHSLMQRAGLAVARLARALAPHARTVWIACGPGNNGGDGLEAAAQLQRMGARPLVTWLGTPERTSADTLVSLARAREAGVRFAAEPPEGLGPGDLCIDALLGIGAQRVPQGQIADWIAALNASAAPTLAVDVPTGLSADTGSDLFSGADTDLSALGYRGVVAQHTLSLLTCKPGLFTHHGRDAAGSVWFDDLGVSHAVSSLDAPAPVAELRAPVPRPPRLHASHKGRWGDVVVIGGEGLSHRGLGMTGAAQLAASAALHAGAGRVLLCLLDDGATSALPEQPELMLRQFDVLDLRHATAVCGCGGGDAVRAVLPAALAQSPRLVLDADALNAITQDPALRMQVQHRAARGAITVLTPHPLEAARLLGTDARTVQANRLAAARTLSATFDVVVVLKGSGSVVAAPGRTMVINHSGDARLATAGTGDVLAGLCAARLAAATDAFTAVVDAVHDHGAAAERFPAAHTLTASALARALTP